ncbi:cytosolic sulfotransferase 13-like [Cicer arietinum]|uniref:Sulfotransferase n=1 Tax=Cicer arietinum TaxID=3827 RepID=A0A1S2XLF8_CICAR|nr:cytosolic sulfotransferase 13-like [Cicer arietinum]
MASKDLTHFKEEQYSQDEQEAISEEENKCKQLILSLPKEIGSGNECLYFYQSFWIPKSIIPTTISFQNHFQAKDSDVVVASMPKSGTTWLKALAFAIVNRQKFSLENHPLLTLNSHELVPHFEVNVYVDTMFQLPNTNRSNMIEPRIFATHVPYPSLAKSVKDSNCRIIYICRNPFDTYVSYWNFMKKLIPNDQDLPTLTIEEDFEKYCKGICYYGPFWDNILGYLKESIARPNKVLFLKYEELKENANFHVKRIGEFLGCPFTQEEESNGMIENIVKLCSFEKMKELETNKFGTFYFLEKNKCGTIEQRVEKKHLFRKAEIGDWVNSFSPSMVEKLSKVMEEKLSGVDLSFKVYP